MSNNHDNGDGYDYDDEMDETQLVDASAFDPTQMVSGNVAAQFAQSQTQNDAEVDLDTAPDATAVVTPESFSGVLSTSDYTGPLGQTGPMSNTGSLANTAPMKGDQLDPFSGAGPGADKPDPFSGAGAISDPNLDFGSPGQWGGDESEGLDDDESEVFSETTVLPISASDEEASNLNNSIDGRFQLLGLLGEGGMGKVYRAKQTSVGRDVAIKLLRTDMGKNEEVRERFLREAQLISGFNHPNIVRLVDFGETDEGRLYLAMEFVNGKTLGEVFKGLMIQPQYVLEMARQVASALIEAHAQDVVHRDLKPDNIFITRIADGSIQFKVLDFGVAKTSTSGLTATGTVYGTPNYMAPEQAQGLKVSAQTDLYAIGVMMYEMLTGRVPFAGQPLQVMLMHVKEEPPYLLDLAPHLPDEVVEIVRSLMAKDPADRIASSIALCDTIEHVMNVNGWGKTYRLPPGPLAETTKEWAVGEDVVSSAGFQMDGMAYDSNAGLKRQSDATAEPPKKGGVIPQPKFEKLELDLPQESKQAFNPQPTVTVERERPRPQRRNQQNEGNNNITLVLILLVLVVIAGALIYGITTGSFSVPGVGGGAIEADGDAKIVLQAVQDSGFDVPFVSTTDVGTVRIQSAKVQRDESIIEVAVHTCETAHECKLSWTDLNAPAVGYLRDRSLVVVEPSNANVSNTDMTIVLDAIQSSYPGGVMSSKRF